MINFRRRDDWNVSLPYTPLKMEKKFHRLLRGEILKKKWGDKKTLPLLQLKLLNKEKYEKKKLTKKTLWSFGVNERVNVRE